jgi:hypothetical protein
MTTLSIVNFFSPEKSSFYCPYTIPLSDLHQLGKALGSRVADVGNGTHHEPAVEGCDTLVESTDLDSLDLSRDLVRMEGETVVVTRRVDHGHRPSYRDLGPCRFPSP